MEHGEMETRRDGDTERWRHGEMETGERGFKTSLRLAQDSAGPWGLMGTEGEA